MIWHVKVDFECFASLTGILVTTLQNLQETSIILSFSILPDPRKPRITRPAHLYILLFFFRSWPLCAKIWFLFCDSFLFGVF